jgi:hypothetical protein
MAPRETKDRRAGARRRLLKTGYIVLSDKAPKLQCTVRNMSAKGASLQVQTTVGIPANFVVIVDGERKACHASWRTDTKLGVVFE